MSFSKNSPGREQRLCSVHEGLDLVFSKPENKIQRLLAALWQNWEMILGPLIAPLALPLGHKENTLIIGAEDNMAMQELSLQTPEILERANAFMDCEFFGKVKVVLLLGQRPLTAPKKSRPAVPLRASIPPRPPQLGGLRGRLDENSPVARCYAAYVQMYDSLQR